MAKLFAKKLNKRGFTLAELLIVVAILAILIAVAIPIYTGVMQDAQKKVNLSNERALKGAATSFILTNWNVESLDEKPGAGAGTSSPGKYKYSEGVGTVGWYAWAWFDGNGKMGTVHVGVGAAPQGPGVVSSASEVNEKVDLPDTGYKTASDDYGSVTNPNIIVIKLTGTEIGK